MPEITGLTHQEVLERRQRGQGNEVELSSSRSYKDIIKTNIFNPVNLVLYAIGIGMLLVGDFRSALATVGLVMFNATIGIATAILTILMA